MEKYGVEDVEEERDLLWEGKKKQSTKSISASKNKKVPGTAPFSNKDDLKPINNEVV